MVSKNSGGKRIAVFAGRFGSGKTEIAINYALSLKGHRESPLNPCQNPLTILIDLDIVTPYFRSREMAETMRQKGVEVIAPAAVSRYVDIPGLSPQILGAIQQERRPVVLDVGGDEQGARALGQFSPYLGRSYTLYFVVNPYRPFTTTAASIGRSIAEIERSSRLRVTALVSNPNLMGETTVEVIEAGHHLLEEASQALHLPIAFIGVEESLAGQFGVNHFRQPMLILRRYFRLPWEELKEEWINANRDKNNRR